MLPYSKYESSRPSGFTEEDFFKKLKKLPFLAPKKIIFERILILLTIFVETDPRNIPAKFQQARLSG